MNEQPPGVNFRGKNLSLKKHFWQGMHRTCSPQETISQIEPYFEKIGLTRLADITGLDRIGIPVILSIRPNSTFLAVDAGKGITPEAATASAAMECIERYHAESVFLDHFSMPYSQLSTEYNAIPVENLPLARCALFNTDHPEQWSLGWDLMGQCEIPVPFLMVTATRNRCRLSDMIFFQVGSTGLASGNHFLEAVYSGLCEVIERDAVTCNMVAAQAGAYKIPMVILDTIEYPLVVEQLTHLERANVKPIIVDCTIDTEVPTYMVIIYDLESRNIGLYAGYGTSLDPEIAMTRAITEACQSRLISISGSRDDFFRSHFNSLKENDDKRLIAIIEAEPATIDARYNKASESTTTFEDDIQILLRKLKKVHVNQTIIFDLTMPGFDIAVARVIVPGLEGYKTDYYTPGPRALEFQRKVLGEKEGNHK